MMMALPDKYLATSPAPRPEVEIERRQKMAEERQAYEQSKRKFHKENAVRNNKLKRETVLLILVVGFMLFGTIYRSGMVYSVQNDYVSLQNETRDISKSNEAMKASLIKASAIGELNEKSILLNLENNGQGTVITVDLSINHFGEEEIVEQPIKLMDRLFSKLD
jgi:cell division protein FtsB